MSHLLIISYEQKYVWNSGKYFPEFIILLGWKKFHPKQDGLKVKIKYKTNKQKRQEPMISAAWGRIQACEVNTENAHHKKNVRG